MQRIAKKYVQDKVDKDGLKSLRNKLLDKVPGYWDTLKKVQQRELKERKEQAGADETPKRKKRKLQAKPTHNAKKDETADAATNRPARKPDRWQRQRRRPAVSSDPYGSPGKTAGSGGADPPRVRTRMGMR